MTDGIDDPSKLLTYKLYLSSPTILYQNATGLLVNGVCPPIQVAKEFTTTTRSGRG